MHNHDDEYPSRPGFEPGTSRLQAPVDKNEPSGPAGMYRGHPPPPLIVYPVVILVQYAYR